MIVQRIGLKLPLQDPGALRPRDFVPVLHRFIQERRLDEVLIDVADYSHVHQGPGVLLICHAANYALDEEAGALGLMYANKRDPAGELGERFVGAMRKLLLAARALEEEPSLAGRVRFAAERVRLRVHDRLLAPNTAATFGSASIELGAAAERLWGGEVALRHDDADPRALFTVDIESPRPATAAALLAQL